MTSHDRSESSPNAAVEEAPSPPGTAAAGGTRDLQQQIAYWSYRILRWGRERVPPVLRSVVGVLLMIGGVFGFLPVLGFWMFPLGLAFIAMDLPFTSARIDVWAEKLRQKAVTGTDTANEGD